MIGQSTYSIYVVLSPLAKDFSYNCLSISNYHWQQLIILNFSGITILAQVPIILLSTIEYAQNVLIQNIPTIRRTSVANSIYKSKHVMIYHSDLLKLRYRKMQPINKKMPEDSSLKCMVSP